MFIFFFGLHSHAHTKHTTQDIKVKALIVSPNIKLLKKTVDVFKRIELKSGGHIGIVIPKRTEEASSSFSISSEGRDVLPRVYEGGLALWECALDLVSFMDESSDIIPKDSNVLELGCGFGLPGIWTLLRGCKRCVFQDLNADVLASATSQHVLANMNASAFSSSRCSLVAGDWFDDALMKLIRSESTRDDGMYDLIITAETLYTPALVSRLFFMLDNLLSSSSDRSLAIVASKRYYFGTGLGGGTSLLLSMCDRKGSKLSAKVVRVLEDGASNIREVLLIRRRE